MLQKVDCASAERAECAHLFTCYQQTYLTLASRRAELKGLQVNKMVLHRARPGAGPGARLPEEAREGGPVALLCLPCQKDDIVHGNLSPGLMCLPKVSLPVCTLYCRQQFQWSLTASLPWGLVNT